MSFSKPLESAPGPTAASLGALPTPALGMVKAAPLKEYPMKRKKMIRHMSITNPIPKK